MKTRTLSLLALLALAACTYPTTTVRTVDTRPQLAFANASPTAVLLVNGVSMGPVSSFDGKNRTLQLDRGTHKVEVQDGGRLVFSQSVYLGDDMTKTITLPN
ncbi:hypothetical protein HHL28_12160 [Aerophototrophica crusticola]|uniref:PEGA domain-containing protein n=1 Tax=Aerophototrophica crusticola TaxID=1709002 RepID=A0A858R8H8_9PROT|nr:hypothetical protein HHL28_12160 [Rhodospirillaceae bacterium B3]